MEQKSNKTIVLDCYRKIIRDLDLSLVDSYVREDYIQHSPTVKNGRAGLLEMLVFLKTLPKPKEETPSPIIRVIADGDFAAVHLDIRFMGKRMAVIDLFRLQNGQLAEHWDASQIQTELEGSEITMTNGTIVIDETADVNKNKSLVEDFYREVFENGNFGQAYKYMAPDYVEHNLTNSLLSKPGRVCKVHRIIGEGDFVVVQCECGEAGKTLALYSILKIAEGNIVEHWSVEQEIPEVMAHNNGMF